MIGCWQMSFVSICGMHQQQCKLQLFSTVKAMSNMKAATLSTVKAALIFSILAQEVPTVSWHMDVKPAPV